MTANTDAELADHCMENTVPEFRAKVRSGCRVLVAGKAFGCGSSREQAARALLGKPLDSLEFPPLRSS